MSHVSLWTLIHAWAKSSQADARTAADAIEAFIAGKIEEAQQEAYADGRRDAFEDSVERQDNESDRIRDEWAVDRFEEFVASAMAADTSDSVQASAVAEHASMQVRQYR